MTIETELVLHNIRMLEDYLHISSFKDVLNDHTLNNKFKTELIGDDKEFHKKLEHYKKLVIFNCCDLINELLNHQDYKDKLFIKNKPSYSFYEYVLMIDIELGIIDDELKSSLDDVDNLITFEETLCDRLFNEIIDPVGSQLRAYYYIQIKL